MISNVVVLLSSFKMPYNGSRLCEVADFQHKCSFEKLNLNLALNCHRSTKPAILQNRCYAFALLFLSSVLLSFSCLFGCVGLVALLQNLALAWACAVLQMCHQMRWLVIHFLCLVISSFNKSNTPFLLSLSKSSLSYIPLFSESLKKLNLS